MNKLAQLIACTHNIAYNKTKLHTDERKNNIDYIRSFLNEQSNEYYKSDWKDRRAIYRAQRLLGSIERSHSGMPARYILSTLMKSGTKHVEQCLKQVYKLERCTPAFDTSRYDIAADRIKPVYYLESDFVYGDSFISYHISPGKDLISDAIRLEIPILIMLRNPAQAIVSHFFYVKDTFNSESSLAPGMYFGPAKIKSEKDLREFLLNKTFKRSIEFIDSWLSLCSKQAMINGLNIGIFHHEELVSQKDFFYERINKFINVRIDPKLVMTSNFEKLKNHNMRKGSTSEWKQFFNDDELTYIKGQLKAIINKYPVLGTLWKLG